MTRAGILSVRAVNQYRRRDVLAYLGLRYYLTNSAAKSDQWATEIAPSLVIRRTKPAYLAVQHFKDIDALGNVIPRDLFLPGPNEALAEAALLGACSSVGKGFVPAECVYSYRLASKEDVSGIYQHYMYGLRARHAAIGHACRKSPDGKVVHLDLRRFYPSISIQYAQRVWSRTCNESGLPTHWVDLGARLLDDQGAFVTGGRSHLLTGPMFSHLIGNLVLKHIDESMTAAPARYFRYVDDISLVGSESEISSSLSKLRSLLEEPQLSLHDQDSPKSLTVATRDWLQGEQDFEDGHQRVSWMSFVGDLKRLLLTQPECRNSLIAAFLSEGFRMPVPDYSGAIGERTYRERMARLFQLNWFRARTAPPSIRSVIAQAHALRTIYGREVTHFLESMHSADTFTAKRLLPKIRYRFGRLAYLGDSSELANFASAADGVHQLRFQAVVAHAIATGDLSKAIGYGVNAAQAVAQPLRMSSIPCFVKGLDSANGVEQSLAVLAMNGLDVKVPEFIGTHHELLTFAKIGGDPQLMRSHDPFIQEMACLHGRYSNSRHQEILDSAFDSAEDIGLDTIEQDHQSS